MYRKESDFSFMIGDKEYSKHLINVTFKYCNKEFNRIGNGIYIKFGYSYSEIEAIGFTKCLCFKGEELVAVKADTPFTPLIAPINSKELNKYFAFENFKRKKKKEKKAKTTSKRKLHIAKSKNDQRYRILKEYKAKSNIKKLNTVADLRQNLYEDGFTCDGIKYIRYKRSSGSSRVGKCLFINEKLYKAMHKWELCGLKIKKNDPVDLAALESYISLPLSSIIGTLDIKPENILIIDDYNSTFTDDVIVTDIDNGWLRSYPDTIEITNNIWDGQSLIDKSVMGEYSKFGFVLLRNRFFKSACFNTNLQEWFADNEITDISQLKGFTLAEKVEDIKLITTPSSIKYLKFGKLDKWLKQIDSIFGVVKHDKPTHFFDGRMVQTHYQLLNTLQLSKEDTAQFLKPTLDYLHLLKTNPSVFRYHVKCKSSRFSYAPANSKDLKNDIIYKMLGINEKFTQTKLYYEYRADLLKSFVRNLKCGHTLIYGTYATLLGNPIEMLQYSINDFHGVSQLGIGNIHSTRFPYNTKLLGSRSPHCTMGNILVANNAENTEIDKYFNLTDEIVCINNINENTLNRLSGADMDSDQIAITDNQILLDAAIKNYDKFKVPTSLVPAEKAERHYTAEDQADLDIKTSVNKIGEIINLSQELNTRLWHNVNSGESVESQQELYNDIALLDVLSNIEIDKAKKEFVIDSIAEIQRIRDKYNTYDENDKMIKPNFFGTIARIKGYYNEDKKNYKLHDTTMDYVQQCVGTKRLTSCKRKFIPFSDVMKLADYDIRRVKYAQTNKVIDLMRELKTELNGIWQSADNDYDAKYKKANETYQNYVDSINKIRMSRHTMYWLLKSIESEQCKDISRYLFRALFCSPNIDFYDLIKFSKEAIKDIEESTDGDIEVYGIRYKSN